MRFPRKKYELWYVTTVEWGSRWSRADVCGRFFTRRGAEREALMMSMASWGSPIVDRYEVREIEANDGDSR